MYKAIRKVLFLPLFFFFPLKGLYIKVLFLVHNEISKTKNGFLPHVIQTDSSEWFRSEKSIVIVSTY